MFSCEFLQNLQVHLFLQNTYGGCFCKNNTTNNKISSDHLGDKLFLKNVYVIQVLAKEVTSLF